MKLKSNNNDSLPTPPSSPQSHSAKAQHQDADSLPNKNNEDGNDDNNDTNNNKDDDDNNNKSAKRTFSSFSPLRTFPLPSYPSTVSTQANLLHALPDLSASHHHHHHHSLHRNHPLNTIITNPPSSLYPVTPVHHAHEHHHHHHIAPPFMASLYSPRFAHPNPYMPAIDTKLSSSSITMPPINNSHHNQVNNLVPTSSVTDTNKKVLKMRSSSDSSGSSTSSSSSSSSSGSSSKEEVEDDNLADSDYQNEEDVVSDSESSEKPKPTKQKQKRKQKEKENANANANEKTLSGIWVVYYTWDIIRDHDMTKPRYEMELKQHKGGHIEGKCIEDSGPAAWTFLLTGKLEKGKTFKYTMLGEDEEIYGKATFDGSDIIKNGMWYRDKLYLRKGGSLVAARKGTQLPRSLMHKTDIKKMAKRKRQQNKKEYIPPPKRQKRSRSHSQTLPTPPPSTVNNVIVIDESNKSEDSAHEQSRANRRHKIKNKKKIKERIKKIRQRKNKLIKYKEQIPPSIPDEYSDTNLTGAWSLYFDNSVNNNSNNNKHPNNQHNDDNDYYYDEDDEPINNDTLFLCHNQDTNELSGFVCSPLKCHVTGHVSRNGIDVRLIMIWSPNKELGGQFAGYVTVINGEYDCDRGLNCEYCSFHCTSYFHTMLYRRFENELSSNELTSEAKMQQFQYYVKAAVDETACNNSDYVSIVEEWFHQNEKDVSPGAIRNNNNNSLYSNQCIWKRRKLPITNYNHVHQRICCRKRKHKQTLPEFMIRQNRICKNKSVFFFGDMVQLFITLETVSSHPLSYYVKDCDSESNYDSDLEDDDIPYFGAGKWVDGIIINVYESKVLVRYFYENALYQQWIDCDINSNTKTTQKVTIQPLIRLRKSLKFSSHLNRIISELNINALSEWRLNLNKSCVCFVCDKNGEWAKAVIKRRFGCFVYIHWVHFDAKYDEYLSIHSERIQPLNASDICNSFRTQLKFQNVLRIKPPQNKPTNMNVNDFIDKDIKTTATSNIFGSVVLHLQPATTS